MEIGDGHLKMVGTGSITVGTLVAFTWYIEMFWRPIMNITNFYNVLITSLAAAERIFDINQKANVDVNVCFYMPDNADEFQLTKYDYIVDAVDTVTAKLELITRAKSAGVPIISCMGAGNKLDPTMLEVADIYKTSMDPLAKVMRTELKKRGIKSLKVVYSKEKPIKPIADNEISCKYNCICPPGTVRKCADRRSVPGSVSFVPSVAGLIIAGETVKDLIAK